ncbi:MAG: isoprenylcysteine carboxylmethyltransferase family protein [Planctomycetota bacterium]
MSSIAKTTTTQYSTARYWAIVLVGSFLHAMIVIIPAWWLMPVNAWPISLWSFFASVILMGTLESCLAPPKTGPPDAVEDPLAIRIAGIVGLSIVVLFWCAQFEAVWTGNGQSMNWLNFVGAGFMIGGAALRLWAIATLGQAFVSDIRKDGPRVTSGPYQWLHHPGEIGMLLFVLGGIVSLGAYAMALAAACLLTPISLWRMRRETRLFEK